MTSSGKTTKQLIIQLARFGDLLQLAPLTRELGKSTELHLLIDASLESTASLLPDVTKIIPVPRSEALRQVLTQDFIGGSAFWRSLSADLKSEHYDRILNVTHTPESGLIALLTGCSEIRGASYDRRGLTTRDPWERLFRSTISRRDFSGFHLVDYHRLAAGIDMGTNPELKSPDCNSQLATRNSPRRIALQLGANSPLRRWSVESFVRLASAISRASTVNFLLLGSGEESPLAARFQQLSGLPATDLTGKTSPSELTKALKSCDLLISGDTGTIHLAALLGIRSVGIYLGMARADDTAPYHAGDIIFEPRTACHPCTEDNVCRHLSCHRDVLPDKVAETALDLLRGAAVIPEDTPYCRRRIVSFDRHGLLTLSSATETPSDLRRTIMRSLWLSEFKGITPSASGSIDPLEVRKLAYLADLSHKASQEAATFRSSLAQGTPNRALLDQIRTSIAHIESQASDSGLIGLLTQIYSLELERPASQPLQAIKEIESTFVALSRRSQMLISLNTQHSTLNSSAGAA